MKLTFIVEQIRELEKLRQAVEAGEFENAESPESIDKRVDELHDWLVSYCMEHAETIEKSFSAVNTLADIIEASYEHDEETGERIDGEDPDDSPQHTVARLQVFEEETGFWLLHKGVDSATA